VRYAAGIAMTDLGEAARPRLNDILTAAAANDEAPLPPVWEDPIHLGNGRLAFTLFYPGGAYGGPGLLSKSITGVDRSFLYPAIRAISKNPDGLSRSSLRSTYGLLTFTDVLALAPEIVTSIENLCEANTMFGNGVRLTGIDMLARYRIAEGVPLTKIVIEQDGVGRADREVNCLQVFEQYAGGVRLVTPDQVVEAFINGKLQGWTSAGSTDQINAANAALDAIAADTNPAPLYSFKALASIAASPGELTLPANTTTLDASVADQANRVMTYTWTKKRGAGNVSFSPNGNTAARTSTATFNTPGTYLLTMTAYDGLTSVSGTVTVVVNGPGGTLTPNDPPVANPQGVTTAESEAVQVTLSGSDPEGYALYYSVASQPVWGSLSGIAPNLTYTPVPFFHGMDNFTFEVMDSEGQVSSANVSITVTAASHQLLLYEGFDYPVGGGLNNLSGKSGGIGFASGSSWTADANNENATYGGFDIQNGSGTAPWNGVLSSVPQTGRFAGATHYANVPDHLWAHRTLGPAVTNEIANGTTLWMSYAIAASHFNNRASLAIGAGRLLEDRGALAGGEAIGIGNGTNAGFGAAYWKDTNGSPSSVEVHSTGASFAFNSATATSTTPYIVVARIEWDADAGKDRVSMYRWADGATLRKSDFESNAVSISADLNQAAFNTLSLQGARYQVDELRVGNTFEAVVTNLNVSNRAPLSANQSIRTPVNTPRAFTLAAMDPDDDPLTYTIVASPAHGTLSGTAPNLTYQPAAGFYGSDSLTFRANDGASDSPLATVSIGVGLGTNATPVADSQSVTVVEDTPTPITLTGTDRDGDPLTYAIRTAPSNGVLTGTPPNLTYTVSGSYLGPDSFTFEVRDPDDAVSNPATVSITVAVANWDLLLHEGFDYSPSGPNGLHGKSGGTGFAAGSSWTADANNETATHGFDLLDGTPAATNPAPWSGVLSSVPQTGNFAGSALYANAPDHLWAHRALGPAVTNEIANGTTLWMSYAIAATHFNNRASFAIGAGRLLEDRGALASGEAIGIGNGTGAGFGAAYWKDENGSPSSVEVHSTGASFAFDSATATSTTPYIVVARIEWDADAGKDRVSMYRWPDGNTLSEATFNANAVSISADLNQAAFNTLSLQGARYQIDELRVGKTFDAVIGLLPPPPPANNYALWAQASGLSGADALFTSDSNTDGIANGLAYFLGAADAHASAFGLLPTASLVSEGGSDYLEFVHRRMHAAAGLASVVAHSENFTSWTTAEHGVDGVTITVTDDGFGPGIDRIVTRIPAAGRRQIFARVTIWENAP
jgi:hypothetical protein